MKIPSSIITMLVGIGLTLVSLWYGHNHGLMPVSASEEAPLIDGLFDLMMTISTGLFILVQGVIIVAAVRYRRKPGDDTDGPPVHGNIPLEILWTALPAIIVLGISIYSFEIYNSIGGLNPMDHSGHSQPRQIAQQPGAAIAATLRDPQVSPAMATMAQMPKEPSNTYPINAMGLQYAWIFSYPETGVSAGELHMPVGREIVLNITAQDVLHAFWVPEFRVKQDAIPGRASELRIKPNRPGEYPVICAELCGPYHGIMKTKVIAQTPEDFDAWMAEQKALISDRSPEDALQQAIAQADPAKRSTDEFLTPHAAQMGVEPTMLHQLHAMQASAS